MFQRMYVLLVALSLGVFASAAEVERVTVHVEGMACPFCTYNLEKRLTTLEGVPDDPNWEASVEAGTASFDWKPGVPFDEEQVREQIRRAGFTPGRIETVKADEEAPPSDKAEPIQLSGVVRVAGQTEGKEIVLRRPDGAKITLRAADRVDRAQSHANLRDYAVQAETARVSVWGMRSQGDGQTLLLHRWQPAAYGSETLANVSELVCERCSAGVMRTLAQEEAVIHAEADFKDDRVRIWSQSSNPPVSAWRRAMEDAGFTVTHMHSLPADDAERATSGNGEKGS